MKQQRGGFGLGMIVGLLIGLALALGVALYVTKVPVPFIDKMPRHAEPDTSPAERGMKGDPNAPLGGKAAQQRQSAPSAEPAPAPSPAAEAPPAPPVETRAPPTLPPSEGTAASRPALKPAAAPKSTRDPAAILSGEAATPTAPAASAARSTKAGADPFTYFVQVGAYARPEDAEQQRARLAMLGYTARVTEREQSGRTVFRVRLGPFERKEDAEGVQDRLRGSTIESALVRVER